MSSRPDDFLVRVVSAAIALPVVFWIATGAPQWVFASLVVAVVFASAWEATRLVFPSTRRGDRLVTGLGALAVHGAIVHFASTNRGPHAAHAAAIVSLLMGTGLGSLWTRSARAGDRSRLTACAAAGLIVALCGSLLAFLVVLREQAGASAGAWTVLALALSWGTDIGGYLAGRAFGGPHPFPKLSPGKTVAGFVGGWLAAGLFVLGLHLRYDFPFAPLVMSGVVWLGALISQAGDLFESAIKRSSGQKDSGKLIPGTGGVLDAVDGIAWVSPFVYVVFLLAG